MSAPTPGAADGGPPDLLAGAERPDPAAIDAAFGALAGERPLSNAQRDLLRSMLSVIWDLGREGIETGDLKIADAALAEMTEAFRVFRPYRHVRKLTMFGSARTQPEDPVYVLARDLARHLADAGWMVITGAGPGIMAAGIEGAGRDRSFGINIRLPHEEGANPFIAQDPKLVEMRYFFTRKLMLIKESHGYAVLPGGFGTQDECYELLTLIQTGKAEPAPIVLVDTPGASYWEGWEEFLVRQAIAPGLGLARGPGPVPAGRLGGGGGGRGPRLLPQLPLVPLGRRPAGPAARRRRPRRPSWPTSTAASPTSSPRAPSGRPRRSRPERSSNDHLELPGWPCASTSSTSPGCAP